MPFVISGNTVLFATSEDVVARDARVFESNEGLTQQIADDACLSATNRIVGLVQQSDWWRAYFVEKDANATSITGLRSTLQIPAPLARRFVGRRTDWTDACVFFALKEYILPQFADFGNPESAERQKIAFYEERFSTLFRELLATGDWYDWDADGTVELAEKWSRPQNIRRQR